MPKLGLTMTEGIVAEWRASSGDRVAAGDVLFCVETEKAIVDVEAEARGVFRRGSASVGDAVAVGVPVATIDGSDTVTDTRPGSLAVAEARAPAPAPAPRRGAQASTRSGLRPVRGGRTIATPYARVLARERQVDLGQVRGSGPNGRIKAVDVAGMRGVDVHRVPASRNCTLIADVDVSVLETLRAKLNQDATLPPLPLASFVIAAAGRALVEIPAANRLHRHGESVQVQGSAVATAAPTSAAERRLQVIGDAGVKSVEQIAAQLRETQIASAVPDRADAAMTVQVATIERIVYCQPAIEDLQSLVLGVGSVRDAFRADAQQQPVPYRQVGLVLTADTRVVDDTTCMALLARVGDYLEAPYRLLCRL